MTKIDEKIDNPASASVIDEIAAERRRQIEVKGHRPQDDDQWSGHELAKAAACYAWAGSVIEIFRRNDDWWIAVVLKRLWPWRREFWKPKNRRNNLIRAAALLVAEIERLDRAAKAGEQSHVDTQPALLWWPEDQVDEIMPDGRASPDAWIVDFNGAPALDISYEGDEEPLPAAPLIDAQVVRFISRTDHGTANLQLTADGYTVDAPMPPEADQCCILMGWQWETMADTLDECVSMLREADADPGEYTVSYYTFSNGEPFMFDAATRRFISTQKGQ